MAACPNIVTLFLLFTLSFSLVSAKKYFPTTSAELRQMLLLVEPGDVIKLGILDYEGDFTIRKNHNGNIRHVITIEGSNDVEDTTTIISGGTAFDVKGEYWVIQNLQIKDAFVGINLEGTNNLVSSVKLTDVDKGVIMRGNESSVQSSKFQYNTVGISVEGGHGSTIEDNHFKAIDNSLVHAAPLNQQRRYSLLVSKDSCCGKIKSNDFHGQVSIEGNNFDITSNKGHDVFKIVNCDNTLKKNDFKTTETPDSCQDEVTEPNNSSNSANHPLYCSLLILLVAQILFCIIMTITFSY